MIKEWVHDRRLEKVVRELPFYMGRDIKPKEKYSTKQILHIFNKYKFSKNYIVYAFAMFSNESKYNKLFGQKQPYSRLRSEIAQRYFNGNTNFKYNDLINITRFKGQVFSYDGSGTDTNHLNWRFTESIGGGGDGGGGDS